MPPPGHVLMEQKTATITHLEAPAQPLLRRRASCAALARPVPSSPPPRCRCWLPCPPRSASSAVLQPPPLCPCCRRSWALCAFPPRSADRDHCPLARIGDFGVRYTLTPKYGARFVRAQTCRHVTHVDQHVTIFPETFFFPQHHSPSSQPFSSVAISACPISSTQQPDRVWQNYC
jgi:hypothetical protein